MLSADVDARRRSATTARRPTPDARRDPTPQHALRFQYTLFKIFFSCNSFASALAANNFASLSFSSFPIGLIGPPSAVVAELGDRPGSTTFEEVVLETPVAAEVLIAERVLLSMEAGGRRQGARVRGKCQSSPSGVFECWRLEQAASSQTQAETGTESQVLTHDEAADALTTAAWRCCR